MNRALVRLALILVGVFPVMAEVAEEDVPPGMVSIPAGEFWQGRVYRTLIEELGMFARARIDDLPAHVVFLDTYYIDKNEVTNAEYNRFAQASGHRKPFHWVGGLVPPGRENVPVYNVSWDDARAFCAWAGKRLPTESEWEKAARGGSDRTRFPWGDQLAPTRGQKNAHVNWPEGPVAVGSYPANGYGLHDVVGNLAEWVADWYGQNYYSVSAEKNPQGPHAGLYRVIRSGSWNLDDERHLAVDYRNFADPETQTVTIGFRCAKSPAP